MMPPLVTRAPSRPVPLSTPPLFTVTAPARLPFRTSVPALTVVSPVKVLAPLERQRAGAVLGQAARAADRAGEGRAGVVAAHRHGAGAHRHRARAGERCEGLIEAVEGQCRAARDRDGARRGEDIRRTGLKRAAIDVGGAGVARARQRQRAAARLGEAAAARERRGEAHVVAVGVEGGAARSDRRKLRGDVGRVARRPLQAGAVHGDRAGAETAGQEIDQAAGHRRAARIAVGSAEDEGARACLAERAGARDVGGDGERVGEVGDDRAVVDDGRRDDRAAEAARAEIERAARTDDGRAGARTPSRRRPRSACRSSSRSDRSPARRSPSGRSPSP